MAVIEPVGGFFGLERTALTGTYHSSGVALANGRTCLRAILKITKPSNVYVPYFTCDTLLKPLIEEGIPWKFYGLTSDFEPKYFPSLESDELFLYINYFGLNNNVVDKLLVRYKQKLVVDDTQNYFSKGYEYAWSFNSARKFFGVPDGGYLYGPEPIPIPRRRNESFIIDHLLLREQGRQEEGFEMFRHNESIQTSEFRSISWFSHLLLQTVDHSGAIEKRRNNFEFLHESLKDLNLLSGLSFSSGIGPYCYPFINPKAPATAKFHEHGVFFPTLWAEVLSRSQSLDYQFEKTIARGLLALPIDHRYSPSQLSKVIELARGRY